MNLAFLRYLPSPRYLRTPGLLAGTTVILWLFTVLAALAAEQEASQWQHCQTSFVPDYLAISPQALLAPAELENDVLSISADHAKVEQQTVFHLQGNVQLQRNDMRMRADRASFHRDTEQLTTQGAVRYQTPYQILLGEQADVDLKQDTGHFAAPKFWLLDVHYRGSADTVKVLSPTVMYLNNAAFTSCDNEQQDWVLKASRLRLDHENNVGVARHARIEFMNVPVIYFPYLSFPLEGRKSGFLWAYPGRSNLNGTEITVPYYFNIAPHRDATLTARHYSKRGTQLIGEFRYLNPNNHGQFDAEYLPNDEISDDDRILGAWRHQGTPARGWRTDVKYINVSDDEYLDEFGSNLGVSSLTHLQRHAEVSFSHQNWRFDGRVESYQTLDDTIARTSRPYQMQPRLQIQRAPFVIGKESLGGEFFVTMSAEAVNFDRSDGVVGRRVDLQPYLAWRHETAPGFIEPGLKWRYTQYQLDNQDPTTQSDPNRSLPIWSLDSGLFFERDVTWRQQSLLQTLEPRLYYLYVPFRNQDDLIKDENGQSQTFDSSLPQFNLSQLFRDNRFNGADRVGDANQLSFSLTSRFLNDSGRELFSASIGQIAYFRDRKVVLPRANRQTEGQSDTVAEMSSRWNRHIDTEASVLWSNEDNHIGRGSLKFRYQFDRAKMFDLVYRYERDEIDQVNLALLWPIIRQWTFMGRYHYSLLDNKRLETFVGLEYDSCCWAFRVVRREYVSSLEDENRKEAILLQLELKGLASVGRKIDSAFEDALLND